MTAISLMPPVTACASCEGQQAERNALQIAEARAEAAEAATDGGSAPAGGITAKAAPVSSVTRTLLEPDLAVQASLARDPVAQDDGSSAAQRLQALAAYGAL